MGFPDTVAVQKRLRLLAETEQRPPPRGMAHRNLFQGDAVAEAGTHRLDRRLLGGKALGEKMGGAGAGQKCLPFLLGQDTPREPLSETRQVFVHTGNPYDVGTDPEDHGQRASRISRFISRTASSSPVNSARATMA